MQHRKLTDIKTILLLLTDSNHDSIAVIRGQNRIKMNSEWTELPFSVLMTFIGLVYYCHFFKSLLCLFKVWIFIIFIEKPKRMCFFSHVKEDFGFRSLSPAITKKKEAFRSVEWFDALKIDKTRGRGQRGL